MKVALFFGILSLAFCLECDDKSPPLKPKECHERTFTGSSNSTNSYCCFISGSLSDKPYKECKSFLKSKIDNGGYEKAEDDYMNSKITITGQVSVNSFDCKATFIRFSLIFLFLILFF